MKSAECNTDIPLDVHMVMGRKGTLMSMVYWGTGTSRYLYFGGQPEPSLASFEK